MSQLWQKKFPGLSFPTCSVRKKWTSGINHSQSCPYILSPELVLLSGVRGVVAEVGLCVSGAGTADGQQQLQQPCPILQFHVQVVRQLWLQAWHVNGGPVGQEASIRGLASNPHSEHCFPARSSKLCQNWLHPWRGTLYLCAAVHRHSQCPLKGLGIIWLWKQPSTQAPTWTWDTSTPCKIREFYFTSNDFGFICAGVSNMVSYKRNIWYNLSCLLQT